MAKEPGRRYAHAPALAEDLRRFLADRPIQARRTPAWEHAWRFCRRNRGLAASLAVAASLVAAIVVVWAAWTARLDAELRRTGEARQAEQAGEEGCAGQTLAVVPGPRPGGPVRPATGPSARRVGGPAAGHPDRPLGGCAAIGLRRAARRGDRLPGPGRPPAGQGRDRRPGRGDSGRSSTACSGGMRWSIRKVAVTVHPIGQAEPMARLADLGGTPPGCGSARMAGRWPSRCPTACSCATSTAAGSSWSGPGEVLKVEFRRRLAPGRDRPRGRHGRRGRRGGGS